MLVDEKREKKRTRSKSSEQEGTNKRSYYIWLVFVADITRSLIDQL